MQPMMEKSHLPPQDWLAPWLLEAAAEEHPDSLALTFHPTGVSSEAVESWTYAELLADVRAAANGFASEGVGRGDAVAIVLPSWPQAHIALWGAEAAGIAAVLSPALEPAHLSRILRKVAPKVVVTSAAGGSGAGLHDKVRAALARADLTPIIIVVGEGADREFDEANVFAWDAWLGRQASERWCTAPGASDDVCALFHTGGTTGAPKVALHTHRMQVSNARAVANAGDVRAGDVMLSATPLFHVSGIVIAGLVPFSVGAHVVLMTGEGFRNPNVAVNFWRIVERWNATTFNVVPTILSVLAEQPLAGADISSLRSCACGAAPLSAGVQQKFTDLTGVPVVQGYGCTEATCAVTITDAEDVGKQGSVGRALEGVELLIAQLATDGSVYACPAGMVGSVLVRGQSVFPGYLDEEHNAGTLVGGGWLNTGDLGRLDDDGYLWLVGRAKDLIIRGGHNIDPAPIEEALLSHPDVVGAAAVAQPDRHAGEVPCAYVVLRAGADTRSEDLREFAAARLHERAAIPVRIDIVTALPTTPVGKVFKPVLRIAAAERIFAEELGALAPGATVHGSICDGGISLEVLAPDEHVLTSARQALSGFTANLTFGLHSSPKDSLSPRH